MSETNSKQEMFEKYLILSDSVKFIIEQETEYSVAEIEKLADHTLDKSEIGVGIASGSFQTEGILKLVLAAKRNGYGESYGRKITGSIWNRTRGL